MEDDGQATDLELGALALAPLEIAATLFGPAGVITAIAIALFRGGSSIYVGRRATRRVIAFLEQMERDVGARMDEFDERLRAAEAAEALAAHGAEAAARSAEENQARAIAAVVVKGVLGDEGAVDEAELLLAVLDDMTSLEVKGLAALARYEGSGHPATSLLSEGRREKGTTADAVVARLVARGLLIVNTPGVAGFGLTPLGKQVVETLGTNPQAGRAS